MISLDYFQKSTAFLFPILEMQSKNFTQPIGTYLGIENFTFESTLPLIAVYYKHDVKFKNTLDKIIKHKQYELHVEVDDDYVLVVFDMYFIENDYQNVIEGKYSQLSDAFKTIVINSFNENKLVPMALNPTSHYPKIAELLDCTIEELEGSEICTIPRMTTEGEIYHLKKLELLTTQYQ